jgi:general stress protein 26
MSDHTHPSHDDYDDEGLAKVQALMQDVPLCMLTSVDADGGLVSRPMVAQEVEFDGDLWFFSEGSAPKVANITANPNVNAAFSGESMWLSLKGTADIVRNVAKKKALWSKGVAAWFTGGPEDDSVVLIRVHAQSAEYWDSPGKAVTAISMLKNRLSGDTPDVGENKTVDLG